MADPQRPRSARPSWFRRLSSPLIGPDATTAELALGWGAAVVATIAQVAWAVADGRWSLLQTVIAALFAFDIAGGVVVNATRSGSRWWHRPERTRAQEALFFAAHLHPFVIAWLWPGFSVMQAVGLYGSMLAFAAVVTLLTPGYLQRPVAYGLSAMGVVMGLTVLAAPAGLAWLPPLYYLKLIAAHAVAQE